MRGLQILVLQARQLDADVRHPLVGGWCAQVGRFSDSATEGKVKGQAATSTGLNPGDGHGGAHESLRWPKTVPGTTRRAKSPSFVCGAPRAVLSTTTAVAWCC